MEQMEQEVHFSINRIRRFGLSSIQEARILLYLSRREAAPRREIARVFDLRLVEHLATLGLVVCRNGWVEITVDGQDVLKRCLGV